VRYASKDLIDEATPSTPEALPTIISPTAKSF